MATEPPALYKRFHLDRDDERVDLFRKLANRYGIERALYPGCFVHIAPSFVIQHVSYVEVDRRAKKFFADPQALSYMAERKEYSADPMITFHASSYEEEIEEKLGSFDLLISQYAGFISPVCKQYLRVDGILLANDSHGDASMANLDPDFEFIGVVNRRGEKYSLSESGLDDYFILKRDKNVSVELLRETNKGPGYTKYASGYVFRKIA